MNMVGANAPTIYRQRMLRWPAVIGGMTVAFATDLLTAKSFSLTTERSHTASNAVVNQSASAPATSEG
jgi:hypothetical protein